MEQDQSPYERSIVRGGVQREQIRSGDEDEDEGKMRNEGKHTGSGPDRD